MPDTKKAKPSDIKITSGLNNENTFFQKLFYISVIINILVVVSIFLFRKLLPPELPLFYGLPEGEEQLTNTLSLSLASGTSLVIVLINYAISSLLEQDFLRKILIVAGFSVSIFSLVTTARIMLLVGYL